MNTLIKFLSETYYISGLLLLASFGTALIGYYHKHKHKYLRLFTIYAAASFLQTSITFLCIIYEPRFAIELSNITVHAFIITEYMIIYNLLFQLIRKKGFRVVMHFLMYMFLIFMLYIFIKTKFITIVASELTILNSLCIAIPCIFYFHEIFTSPPLVNLSEEPSFWIVTGYLFMVICTLPFYLLENYLHENMINLQKQIYILNYVFYCLLFVFISKAFLCKPAITKL